MAWSPHQRTMLCIASTRAGWNAQTRYVAMRACGCPLDRADGGAHKTGADRPSVKHPRNTQRHFELVMELAEAAANQRGERVPKPANFRSWADACARENDRVARLIEAIASEASRRLPGLFAEGFLGGFILRMTSRGAQGGNPDFHGVIGARSLSECDGAQLYNVLEGLKAWVGREMLRSGIEKPAAFEIPRGVRARFLGERRRALAEATG